MGQRMRSTQAHPPSLSHGTRSTPASLLRFSEPGDPNVIALEKEFHEHPSKVPPLPPLGPAEGSAAAQPMPRPAMMYERYLGSAFIPASASVAPARAPALDGPPKALALVPKAPPSTLGRGPRTKQRTQVCSAPEARATRDPMADVRRSRMRSTGAATGDGGRGAWEGLVGWLVGCCRYVPALGRGPLGCRPRAAGAA